MFGDDVGNLKISKIKKIDKRKDCKFRSKSPIIESRMGRKKIKIKGVNEINKKRVNLNKKEMEDQNEKNERKEFLMRVGACVLVAGGVLYGSAIAVHAAITAVCKWKFLQDLGDVGKMVWEDMSQTVSQTVTQTINWGNIIVGITLGLFLVVPIYLLFKYGGGGGGGGSCGGGRDSDSAPNPNFSWDSDS